MFVCVTIAMSACLRVCECANYTNPFICVVLLFLIRFMSVLAVIEVVITFMRRFLDLSIPSFRGFPLCHKRKISFLAPMRWSVWSECYNFCLDRDFHFPKWMKMKNNPTIKTHSLVFFGHDAYTCDAVVGVAHAFRVEDVCCAASPASSMAMRHCIVVAALNDIWKIM